MITDTFLTLENPDLLDLEVLYVIINALEIPQVSRENQGHRGDCITISVFDREFR